MLPMLEKQEESQKEEVLENTNESHLAVCWCGCCRFYFHSMVHPNAQLFSSCKSRRLIDQL